MSVLQNWSLGLGFGVWGLGLGFGVWGLGFGVWGWGLGFGVWGLGFGFGTVAFSPIPPRTLTTLRTLHISFELPDEDT